MDSQDREIKGTIGAVYLTEVEALRAENALLKEETTFLMQIYIDAVGIAPPPFHQATKVASPPHETI